MKDAATADRPFTPLGLAWVAMLVVLTTIVGAIPAPDVSSSLDFSTEKALDHIAAIAQQPHPIGSPAAESARRYIVEQLEDLDLHPELQEFEAPDFFGISDGPVTGVNVAVRISGTDSSGAVMLVAHYDTVPTTPGAGDNASGVAAVLETARALQNGPPLCNDVILLLTDGEEPAGRYGATAFVERHPWAEEVAFVVNLEACGTGGPSLLVQTSGADGWLVPKFAAEAPGPTFYSFFTEIADLMGEVGTDFDRLTADGVPGLHFAYLHGSPVYHSPSDTVDRVSPRSLRHHGSNALAAARAFGDLDFAADRPVGEAVYFTLLGRWAVVYPTAWSLPMAAVAGLLLIGSIAVRLRRYGRPLRSVAIGAACVLGQLLVVSMVSAVTWIGITAVRNTPGVIESYCYFVVVVLFSLAVAAAAIRPIEMRMSAADHAAGAASICWLSALATGFWMPGTSYLFVWPAIAVSLILGCKPTRSWVYVCGVAVVAAVAIVLLAPATDIFVQMAQPRPFNADSQLFPLMGVAAMLAAIVVMFVHPRRCSVGNLCELTAAVDPQARVTGTKTGPAGESSPLAGIRGP
jgi:hypothetical protein